MFIVYVLPQSYLLSCSQQIPFPACLCPIFGSGYLSSIGFPSAASGKATSSFGSSLSSVANTSPLPDLAYYWERRKSFLNRFDPVADSEYLFSIGSSVLFVVGTSPLSHFPCCCCRGILPSIGFPLSSVGNILPRSDSLLLLLVNTSPQSDHPCLRPRRKSSPDSISIVASSEYLFSIRSSVLLEVGTFPFSDFPCVAASEYLSSIGFPLSSVGKIPPRSDSLLLLVVNAYSRSGHRRSQR